MSDANDLPLVSAIIPTRNRPELVCRAVRSALNQTYKSLEVVVVVDGPDPATLAALEALHEPRLRIVTMAENVGGSEARNIGVRKAKGDWIAFLDDDDEWAAEKTEKQILFASTLCNLNAFITCKFVERSDHEPQVHPGRLPYFEETIDEYFCANSLITSTLLAPRDLLERVPFIPGLKRGQDFTWMIRACIFGKAQFHVLPDVMSFYNVDSFSDRHRMTIRPKWRDLYAWIEEHRPYFTSHAYSSFVVYRVLPDAINARESFPVKLALLVKLIQRGSPAPRVLFDCLYQLSVPPIIRRWIRIGRRTLFEHSMRRALTPP
jgi:glycosyltransferase involved in cell wall biosynthesis